MKGSWSSSAEPAHAARLAEESPSVLRLRGLSDGVDRPIPSPLHELLFGLNKI